MYDNAGFLENPEVIAVMTKSNPRNHPTLLKFYTSQSIKTRSGVEMRYSYIEVILLVPPQQRD